jgi:hypothetical protein
VWQIFTEISEELAASVFSEEDKAAEISTLKLDA